MATNIRKAEQKIADLRALFPDAHVEIIKTTAGGRTANKELLRKRASILGPQTLLAVAAGDGTVNLVIETLLLDEKLSDQARGTVVLPLWGGNANDLAWMLNGRPGQNSMQHIAERAGIVSIRPILLTLTYQNEVRQYIATCTASFGATALVGQKLNDAAHRQSKAHQFPGGRAIREGFMAWKTVMLAPTFNVMEGTRTKRMYEYTLAKGQRMAKYYHMPIKLTDEWFYMDAIEGKVSVITPTLLTFSFRRRRRSDIFQQRLAFTTIKEDVYAQFDGEIISVLAGTQVEASLCALPFYTLSTKLVESK